MSNELIEQYVEMHKNSKRFPGYSIKPHIRDIGSLVESSGAETLLDYGCGKGYQYLAKRCHESWGILPRCYDPGVAHLSEKPEGVFDGVICTDVLEHIPEDEVNFIITDLFIRAQKFVFMSIATFPSRKELPNGMNCHVTVKGKDWWLAKIRSIANIECVVSFRHSGNEFELVKL